MRRTAVLYDERDARIGSCQVAESTVLINAGTHGLFIRTDRKVRLAGGGLGAVFEHVEPAVRERLDPI